MGAITMIKPKKKKELGWHYGMGAGMFTAGSVGLGTGTVVGGATGMIAGGLGGAAVGGIVGGIIGEKVIGKKKRKRRSKK
jgi:hypothetical protein